MQQVNITLKSAHDQRPFAVDIRWVASQFPKPIVLFVHGFKGFKDWGPFNMMADYIARQGFIVAKLNLSHNGTTPENELDFVDLEAFGRNNLSIELDDIGAAIDFLCQNNGEIPINRDELYLIGHSRGGGLTMLKAAEDARVKKVATWASVCDYEAFLSIEEMAKWKEEGVRYIWNGRTEQNMPLYYQIYEDYLANKERLNILSAVSKLPLPLLVVHGLDDETVPLAAAKQIHGEKSDAQLFLVPGGTHTFGGYHPYTDEQLIEPLKTVVDKTIVFFRQP